MLPTANFEPVRCTLLSVRAFDFDNSLCSFSVNDGDSTSSRSSTTRPYDKNFLKRFYESELRKQQHVPRTRDRYSWKVLQRASSTPRIQVKHPNKNNPFVKNLLKLLNLVEN
ncbi:hypothetical protein PGB90_001233 [Kerria lacca]